MITCEDYPACGHLYGECEDRPEFTSAYWSEVLQDPSRKFQAFEPGSPEWYDALDEKAEYEADEEEEEEDGQAKV